MNRQITPNPVNRHRRATLAITSAVLAAAGLTVAAQVPSADATNELTAASRPTTLRQPTKANLVTTADLADLARVGETAGRPVDRRANTWGQEISLCQQSTRLGQRTVLVRDYPKVGATEVVLGFRSAAKATAARNTILGWYSHCVIDTDTNSTQGMREPQVRFVIPKRTVRGVTPFAVQAASAVRRQADVTSEDRDFEKATIIQTGNRLAWLVQRTTGQDDNCSSLPNDPNIGQCGVWAAADETTARLLRR